MTSHVKQRQFNPQNLATKMSVDIPPGTSFEAAASPMQQLLPEAHVVHVMPPGNLSRFDDTTLRILREQGFTEGLANSLETNVVSFPLRIWIVDNSGSMKTPDGHRLFQTSSRKDVRLIECSRWQEIKECVQYHVRMAALLAAPTNFRLLNPSFGSSAREFSIAEETEEEPSIASQVEHAQSIMHRATPTGVTPLTERLYEVRERILPLSHDLGLNGQRVVIVIATDGLPSNANGEGGYYERELFIRALRSLEGLPVWVVVRLCTDGQEVVDFYNDLDEGLELSLEVLDDFVSEAQEVYEHNKWLNYSLPIHRLREMGFHNRVFDLIDERPLSKWEICEFCTILFGKDKMDGMADPMMDWDKFIEHVARLAAAEDEQWNPITRRFMPVINISKLKRHGKHGLLELCVGCMP